MSRNRLPADKAEVSGAAAHDPQRHRDRKSPRTRPLGEPYKFMTGTALEIWEEFRADLPWLRANHRMLLSQVCLLAARMRTDPEFGVSAHQALSSMLSKLGATPADETKVIHGADDGDDLADEFFGRSN